MANNFEYKIHVSIDQKGLSDDVKKSLMNIAKEQKGNAFQIELTGDPKNLIQQLVNLKKQVPTLDLSKGLQFNLADAIADDTEQGKKIINEFATYIINSVSEAVTSIDALSDSIKNTESALEGLKARRKNLLKDDGSADVVTAFEKAQERLEKASNKFADSKQNKGKLDAAEEMKQAYQDIINYQSEAGKEMSDKTKQILGVFAKDKAKVFKNANGEITNLAEHLKDVKVNSSYKEDLRAIESQIFENENKLTQLRKNLESAQNPELQVKGKLADNFLGDLQSQLDQMTGLEVKVKPKVDRDVKLEVEVDAKLSDKSPEINELKEVEDNLQVNTSQQADAEEIVLKYEDILEEIKKVKQEWDNTTWDNTIDKKAFDEKYDIVKSYYDKVEVLRNKLNTYNSQNGTEKKSNILNDLEQNVLSEFYGSYSYRDIPNYTLSKDFVHNNDSGLSIEELKSRHETHMQLLTKYKKQYDDVVEKMSSDLDRYEDMMIAGQTDRAGKSLLSKSDYNDTIKRAYASGDQERAAWYYSKRKELYPKAGDIKGLDKSFFDNYESNLERAESFLHNFTNSKDFLWYQRLQLGIERLEYTTKEYEQTITQVEQRLVDLRKVADSLDLDLNENNAEKNIEVLDGEIEKLSTHVDQLYEKRNEILDSGEGNVLEKANQFVKENDLDNLTKRLQLLQMLRDAMVQYKDETSRDGATKTKYEGFLSVNNGDLQNFVSSLYEETKAAKKAKEALVEVNEASSAPPNTSAMDKVEEELHQEAQAHHENEEAAKADTKAQEEASKTVYRAYNRTAGIMGEEGMAWFSDDPETMKTYVAQNPNRNVIKSQIDTSNLFKLDAQGAKANAITYLGDQSDEASKKITEVYNKIQAIKKELSEKPNDALSEELKQLELEYDELSEDERNMYGTHTSTQFGLYAKNAGYKGIEISNVIDDYNMKSGKISTTIALFDNESLKETEDITSQIKENTETIQQTFNRQSAINSHADFLLSRESIDNTETDIDILTNKLQELDEENRLVTESADSLGEKLREITTATSEDGVDAQNIRDFYSYEIGDVFDKETNIGKYYDYLVQNTDFGATEEEVSSAYEQIAQKILDFQKEVINIVRSKIESIMGVDNQNGLLSDTEDLTNVQNKIDVIRKAFDSMDTRQTTSEGLFNWIKENCSEIEQALFNTSEGIEEFKKVIRGLAFNSNNKINISETLGLDIINFNELSTKEKELESFANSIEGLMGSEWFAKDEKTDLGQLYSKLFNDIKTGAKDAQSALAEFNAEKDKLQSNQNNLSSEVTTTTTQLEKETEIKRDDTAATNELIEAEKKLHEEASKPIVNTAGAESPTTPLPPQVEEALVNDEAKVDEVVEAEKKKFGELGTELSINIPQAIDKKNEALDSEKNKVDTIVQAEIDKFGQLETKIKTDIPQAIEEKNKALDTEKTKVAEVVKDEIEKFGELDKVINGVKDSINKKTESVDGVKSKDENNANRRRKSKKKPNDDSQDDTENDDSKTFVENDTLSGYLNYIQYSLNNYGFKFGAELDEAALRGEIKKIAPLVAQDFNKQFGTNISAGDAANAIYKTIKNAEQSVYNELKTHRDEVIEGQKAYAREEKILDNAHKKEIEDAKKRTDEYYNDRLQKEYELRKEIDDLGESQKRRGQSFIDEQDIYEKNKLKQDDTNKILAERKALYDELISAIDKYSEMRKRIASGKSIAGDSEEQVKNLENRVEELFRNFESHRGVTESQKNSALDKYLSVDEDVKRLEVTRKSREEYDKLKDIVNEYADIQKRISTGKALSGDVEKAKELKEQYVNLRTELRNSDYYSEENERNSTKRLSSLSTEIRKAQISSLKSGKDPEIEKRNKILSIYISKLKEQAKYEEQIKALRGKGVDDSDKQITSRTKAIEGINNEIALMGELNLTEEENLNIQNRVAQARRQYAVNLQRDNGESGKQKEINNHKREYIELLKRENEILIQNDLERKTGEDVTDYSEDLRKNATRKSELEQLLILEKQEKFLKEESDKAENARTESFKRNSKTEEALLKRRQNLLQQITQWLKSNPIAEKKYGSGLKESIDQLNSSAKLTPKILDDIEKEFKDIKLEATKAGETGASFGTILRQRWQSLGAYLASFASFYQVVGYVRKMIESVKELDSALTEMRKVSDESVATLKAFQKESFDIADQVGSTAKVIQDSTADWMRLGRVKTYAPLYSNIY